MSCYPWWHSEFLRFRGIFYPGGYTVPDDPEAVNPALLQQGLEDFVPTSPEVLRANAERQLRALGVWLRATPLPLEAYSLARNAASEIGRGTAEEKVLLMQTTINHARRRGRTPHEVVVANTRLPNHYGRIHRHGDPKQGSPYGRFTASTREPSAEDVMIAVFVLEGNAGTFPHDFARGGDDQAQANTASWVQHQAESQSYWVGPLPGVDDFRIRAFRTLPGVLASSPVGRQLVQSALERLRAVGTERGEVRADCVEPRPEFERLATLSGAKKLAIAALAGVATILAGVAVASLVPVAPSRARRPGRVAA